jgi:hypothetical protein
MPPGPSVSHACAALALAFVVVAGAGCSRSTQSAASEASPLPVSAHASNAKRTPAPRAGRATAVVPFANPSAAATATSPQTPAVPNVSSNPPAAAATPAGPHILSISTSPEVVHAGTHVVWDVRTSPDVVTVTAHVSTYSLPLVRQGAGRFGLTFSVPSNVPGFFHGTYSLDVIAKDGSGATADRTVSVSFE